jgi:hypothetical protein
MEILWLVGRFAFLALLYVFVLLVLRALLSELRSEAPVAWASRAAVQPVAPDPGLTGELSRPVPSAEPVGLEPAMRPAGSLPPRLTVVASADTEALPTGTTFVLGAISTIGRGPHNSVAIPSDKFASTNHALAFARGGAVYVRDRGSTNGVLVNDAPVQGDALLQEGDRIALGTTVFRFSAGEVVGEADEPPGPET